MNKRTTATRRRQRQPTSLPLARSAVVVLLLAACSSQVAASSSYIDDYFIPTAKLALNKIQQSFAPQAARALHFNNQTAASNQTETAPTISQQPQGATAITILETNGQLPALNSTASGADDEQAAQQQQVVDASAQNRHDDTTRAQRNHANDDTQSKLQDAQLSKQTTDYVNLEPANQRPPPPSADSSSTTQAATPSPAPGPANGQSVRTNDDTGRSIGGGGGSETSTIQTISSTESTPDDPIRAEMINAKLAGAPTAAAERNQQSDPTPTSASDESGGGGQSIISSQQAAAAAAPAPAGDQSNQLSGTGAAVETQPAAAGSGAGKQQQPAIVAQRPDEQLIRDTESEAIAAVDASILFGSAAADLFASSTDTCYDEYGNARFCEPEFENVAADKPLEVSSECGQPASRFCTATYSQDQRNDQIRNCHICDNQHPKKRHPAAYLTDAHNPDAPTCWVSAPINATNMSTQPDRRQYQVGAGAAGGGPPAPLHRDNVTLTLRLNKAYEIAYVSLQFCSLKPDSLAIYKSADFGLNWAPLQYFSSQCQRVYKTAPAGSGPAAAAAELSGSPGCTNVTSGGGGGATTATGQQRGSADSSPARVAFSAARANGRPSAGGADRWAPHESWITATDLRVALDRHQMSWIQSSLAYSHHHQPQPAAPPAASNNNNDNNNNKTSAPLDRQLPGQHEQPAAGQHEQQATSETSLTSPSDTYNYAIADLIVGARCKCNGHASRCVHGQDGGLQCDCRHNTAGRDCERCASFHFDRPWQPAGPFDANPCQPCQCNGHSRRCRFDPEIYQLSGQRSGGVCINCRDNTAGRHCHYCREGFTRDHSRPMSDKEACKPCDCHPVGSLGRVCNQTTGQCPCKEGVTGLECNRCAPGYQQSSSPTEPCIKLPENDINYEPTIELSENEQPAASFESSNSVGQLAAPSPPAGGASRSPDSGTQLPADDDNTNSPLGATNDQLATNELDAGAQFAPAAPSRSQRPQAPPVGSRSHHWPHPRQPNQANYKFVAQHARRPQQYDDDDGANEPAPPGAAGDQLGDPSGDSHEPAEFPPSPIGGRYLYPAAGRTQPRPTMGADYRPLASGATSRLRHQQLGSWQLQQQQKRPLLASLDELGDGGELQPGDELAGAPRFAGQAQLLDPNSYATADEMHEFNQIMTNVGYQHSPTSGASNKRNQQQPNNGRYFAHRHHLQPAPLAPTRHRQLGPASSPSLDPLGGRTTQPAGGPPPENSITCADCQSGTRRLSWRQFCHLDYAIRAQVLSKYMAEDWTRLEVEIQDIFKSPTGPLNGPTAPTGGGGAIQLPISGRNSAAAASSSHQAALNYVDNFALYQSDDPNAGTNKTELISGQQMPISNNNQQLEQTRGGQQLAAAPAHHRLKIGSIQSVWIPTEDVNCRCPRLRSKSTYLLMGLVDSKENSIAHIQLDRHGVALEWKSGLQEKLIKYQRRQARKGC